MRLRLIGATAAGIVIAVLLAGVGSPAASNEGVVSYATRNPLATNPLRVLPFSGKIVSKDSVGVFEFLVTRTPPGFEVMRQTVQHFDVISRTLVFLDGAKADRSDLAVGQQVTVFLEVWAGGSVNLVAKRVEARSARTAKGGLSSVMAAVAGSTYAYARVLPKEPGGSGWRKEDKVRVTAFQDGITVKVQWWFWTGSGCRLTNPSGRSFPSPDISELVTSVSANGTFDGVETRALGHGGHGTRSHRGEVHGQFAADGSYVKLKLSHKHYEVMPGGQLRCDGRSVSFRLPRRGGHAPGAPPAEPKPTPQPYETGSYTGNVAGRPMSFSVVRDAAGHGFVRDLQFSVKFFCNPGPPYFEQATERLAGPVSIIGTSFSTTTTADSGDTVGITGSLNGRSASGTLHVSKQHDGTTCENTNPGEAAGWSASKTR